MRLILALGLLLGVIEGSDGNDAIDGGPGDDRLLGGGGHDELSYATRVAPVTADLARETGGEAGETDGVGGFEVLVGGRGADVLRGAAGAEVIDGGAGDDVVRGRGGNDELFGGIGADRLSGDAGRDHLFGDPDQGDDYCTPIIRLRPDRLDGGSGSDSLYDTGGRNTFRGGRGDDLLQGGASPDRMLGGPGSDIVFVRGGGRDRVVWARGGMLPGPTGGTRGVAVSVAGSAGERQRRLGREGMDRPFLAKWSELTPL